MLVLLFKGKKAILKSLYIGISRSVHNQIESKGEKFGDPNANVVSKLYNLKKLRCILYWDFDSKFP